eukprot:15352755-Ditylum_brightwellii.AAC.2
MRQLALAIPVLLSFTPTVNTFTGRTKFYSSSSQNTNCATTTTTTTSFPFVPRTRSIQYASTNEASGG